jgi:hypothetical protein
MVAVHYDPNIRKKTSILLRVLAFDRIRVYTP